MARRKTFRAGLCVLLSAVLITVGFLGGAWYSIKQNAPVSEKLPSGATGDIAIHFLELGNAYTGDCTYIKAGDTDILIDAGSRTSSIATISAYINDYVTDGKLEYVIVTHAHQDHYAGFTQREGSIFDLYECEVIIDFAKTNQKGHCAGAAGKPGGFGVKEQNFFCIQPAGKADALQRAFVRREERFVCGKALFPHQQCRRRRGDLCAGGG